LVWAQKANQMDEKFWQKRLEALILAKLKRYKEAIAAAERSSALATDAGNAGYPRMNAKDIAEWSRMK